MSVPHASWNGPPPVRFRWWFLIGIGATFVLGGLYFFYLLSPVAPLGAPAATIEIPPATGIQAISTLLGREGIVRSVGGFKLYAFLSGAAHRLKPGLYELAAASTTPEIVHALVGGPPTNVSILIPEGFSLYDIEALLVSRKVLKPGALSAVPLDILREDYHFLRDAAGLEGFLFPDTYRFAVGSSPEAVVRKFLDTFAARVLPATAGHAKPLLSILTIASYLEREIPSPEERRLVTGILERRLALGMPLQIDATVLYAACGGRYRGCDPLTKDDFKIDSPFNTYRSLGLTPTPIANPGVGAIEAALNPKPSAFLYYLSDPKTGRTIFARTLAEQNRNRARYLGR